LMTHITTDDDEAPIITLAYNLGVEGFSYCISRFLSEKQNSIHG